MQAQLRFEFLFRSWKQLLTADFLYNHNDFKEEMQKAFLMLYPPQLVYPSKASKKATLHRKPIHLEK